MNLDAALALASRAGLDSIDGERAVEEWIGRTPNDDPPPRVKDRVLRRFGRQCYSCGNVIRAGKPWTCDHLVALILRGENRERNLGPLCPICTPTKDRSDVGEKSSTYRKRAKDLGIAKPKGPPMPGSRRSPFKKTMRHGTVRR